jgi:hypothetical protein
MRADASPSQASASLPNASNVDHSALRGHFSAQSSSGKRAHIVHTRGLSRDCGLEDNGGGLGLNEAEHASRHYLEVRDT